uniref:Ig-like domain-containing protein n=1 Tax=Spermophilus dauricus TaxID=99837 RepID=A0A8C9QNB5_SPEDA
MLTHCPGRDFCAPWQTPILSLSSWAQISKLRHPGPYFHRSLSQPVLTQPPSPSLCIPGASARLTCSLSSGFRVDNSLISWYQQKPENPPHYLLSYYSDSVKDKGSEVPNRFSGSKDASANAGILLISDLQPEDEAGYYCATPHGSESISHIVSNNEEIIQKAMGPQIFVLCFFRVKLLWR